MGANRWQYESFKAGQVRAPFAARPSSREAQDGVQEATNARILPDGSLTQAPGSEFFLELPEGLPGRIFPYISDNEEYLIVVTAGASVSEGGIWLYGKTGGVWSSSPRQLWALQTPGGLPYVGAGGVGDHYGVPYVSTDLDSLSHVQFEDKLFILSPSHPPILIQKEKNQLGGFEYWNVDHHPFTDGGGEIGTKARNTTVVATGISGTVPDPAGTTLTANRGIFSKELEENALTYTVSGIVGDWILGAIYRVGDLKADTADNTGWGNFFSIQKVNSPTEALAQTLTPFTATERNYDNPEQWCGPWTRTITQATLGAVPATGTAVSFTLPAAQCNLDPHDDLGIIIEQSEGGTKKFVIVLGYNPTLDEFSFANIGNPITGSNWTSTFVWRHASPKDMVVIDSVPEGAPNDQSRVSWYDLEALPEGHETPYENGQYKDFTTSATDLGGPVYANGGIFRVEAREDWDNGGITELSGSYTGRWVRHPLSAGPVTGWGWGPSVGAGFADVGVVHQRRLALAGYKRPGSALAISAVGEPTDMEALRSAGFDSGPLNFAVSDARDERIRILESFTTLFIGSDFGEYELDGVPLTNSNIGISKVSAYGSRRAGHARVGPKVLWASSDGRGLRETRRDDRTSGFLSEDLMVMTSVLQDGDYIEQMVQLGGSETQVFIRTANGELLLLSHNEENGTKGFTRVPGQDGDTLIDLIELRDDDAARSQTVWGLWETGDGRYFVERYDTGLVGFRRITTNSVSQSSISGLNQHSSREVDVLIDGVYKGRYTVGATGIIDITNLNLSSVPSQATVMLPCDINVGLHVYPFVGADGPTAGKKFQIRLVNVFIESSYGGKVEGAQVRHVSTTSSNTPFTGWVAVPGSGGSSGLFPIINITTEHPLRFILGGVVLDGTKQTS